MISLMTSRPSASLSRATMVERNMSSSARNAALESLTRMTPLLTVRLTV